jgi:hypothetical protein
MIPYRKNSKVRSAAFEMLREHGGALTATQFAEFTSQTVGAAWAMLHSWVALGVVETAAILVKNRNGTAFAVRPDAENPYPAPPTLADPRALPPEPPFVKAIVEVAPGRMVVRQVGVGEPDPYDLPRNGFLAQIWFGLPAQPLAYKKQKAPRAAGP